MKGEIQFGNRQHALEVYQRALSMHMEDDDPCILTNHLRARALRLEVVHRGKEREVRIYGP